MTTYKLNILFRLDLILYLAVSSLGLTLFLAFVDEGNYNFNWAYDVGSWGAILVYFGLIYLIHLLVFKLALGKFEKIGKAISLISTVTVITIMIYLGNTGI